MNITTKRITEEVNNEFAKTYKAHGSFINSGSLWDKCIDTVGNVELLNHIIFCNDVLKVPPVKVFLLVHDDDFSNLTDFDRKCLGAFWGFVFKFIFMYNNQKSTSISTKGIKTATYFYDAQTNINVISE
ncbi:hypothetical protein PMW00_06345 [Clostridium paraputrificum]|uniref:hypothetical protein n=1 Tax=Clostridium paraputrificum TaxID=29363 RepID=UPI00232EFF99|nr:hypothetical protein [Clostridium paraputrificum]MDB2102643.1 hypothetical protein [Clostridium paraputrificum]